MISLATSLPLVWRHCDAGLATNGAPQAAWGAPVGTVVVKVRVNTGMDVAGNKSLRRSSDDGSCTSEPSSEGIAEVRRVSCAASGGEPDRWACDTLGMRCGNLRKEGGIAFGIISMNTNGLATARHAA